MKNETIRTIESALVGMGVNPALKGYFYLIELTVGKIIEPMRPLRDMYADIAKDNNCSANSISKAVDRAIITANMRSDAYKRYISSEYGTTKGFVSLLAYNVKRELEDGAPVATEKGKERKWK